VGAYYSTKQPVLQTWYFFLSTGCPGHPRDRSRRSDAIRQEPRGPGSTPAGSHRQCRQESLEQITRLFATIRSFFCRKTVFFNQSPNDILKRLSEDWLPGRFFNLPLRQQRH